MTETELERLVVRLTGDMSGLKASLNQADTALSQFSSKITTSISASTALATGAVVGIGMAAANTIISLSVQAANSLYGLGKSAVELGMDLEKTTVAFETMLGGGTKGTARAQHMLEEIRIYAAATPFEQGPLRESAKMLMNYGIAAEKVMPTLKMLGEVSAGDQNKLNGLSYAFAQMAGRGRVAGDDLRQMVNHGFNPLQEMSRTTGQSMAALTDKMHNGQITIKMLEEAFRTASSEGGRFYGMMDKQSKTLFGLYSTMKDNISNVLTQVGTMLIRQLGLKDIIGNTSGALERYTQAIVANVKSILTFIRPIFLEVVNVVGAAFNAIGIIGKRTWERFGTQAIFVLQTLKLDLMQLLVAAEFVFNNIDRVAALAAVSLLANLTTAFEEVKYYLTTVIPTAGALLLDNWKQIFLAMANNARIVMANIAENMIHNFLGAMDVIATGGKFDFQFMWLPIQEQFQKVFQNLPNIPKREMGAVEKTLHKDADDLANSLWGEFSEFSAKRMNELMPELADELKLEFPGFEKAGPDLSGPLNKHGKTQSTFDAAIIGSKEASAHLAEYQQGLTKAGDNNPQVQVKNILADAKPLWQNMAVALQQIQINTLKTSEKEPFEIATANLVV